LDDVNAGLSITVTDSSTDPAVLARKHTSGSYVESVEFDFEDVEVRCQSRGETSNTQA
jgi:hypothetical protein